MSKGVKPARSAVLNLQWCNFTKFEIFNGLVL